MSYSGLISAEMKGWEIKFTEKNIRVRFPNMSYRGSMSAETKGSDIEFTEKISR